LYIYRIKLENNKAKGLYIRFEHENLIVSSTPYDKNKGYELFLGDFKCF